ncbi:MAG: hypothetical protein R8L07_04185 [Alphaproteobacteria bacterium]|nr:hypothetical protein [Alphaproteobacteria bacterium]
MLSNVLNALSRRAPLLLALGVMIGLAAPGLAEIARPLLAPSIWILLTLAAVRIDPAQSIAHIRRPGAVLATLLWMLVVTPLLAWGILTMLPVDSPGLAAALVLMAGAAPLMSTPSLAQILGLDDALAMLVMVIATMLSPFTLPFIALHLLGFDLGIDPMVWSLQLTLFIGSAVAVALILRRMLGADRIKAARQSMDLAMVALLLTFSVAIMDGVTDRLLTETAYVLGMTGIAFLAYGLFLAAGTLAGLSFGKRVALTIGFVGSNRNVGVILAVLPAGAHPDIFLYFAIWQLPMYIMPAILTHLYKRTAVAGVP